MGKVMLLSVRIFGAWCLWWVVLLISPANWEFVTRCCELFDELFAVYWSWCAFFWGVKSCYDIFMMCGSWGSEFGKVGKTCIKHGEFMVNPWWIHGESMVTASPGLRMSARPSRNSLRRGPGPWWPQAQTDSKLFAVQLCNTRTRKATTHSQNRNNLRKK